MSIKKPGGWMLCLILLLGVLIQISSLEFLLPDFAIEDEMVGVSGFYQLIRHDFSSPGFYKYPGLLFFLLSLVLYPGYLVINLKTLIHLQTFSDLKFFLGHPSLPDASAIYLGRIESLLGAILAVWIFYRIFSKKIGARPSLIASLFLISSPAWLFSSSVLKNDGYLLCAILILIYACFQIGEKARLRDYLLAGIALGLCLAAKYHIFALVPLLAAHWLAKPGFSLARKVFNKQLISALVFSALTFFVLSPAQFLDPGKTLSALGLELAIQQQALPLLKASSRHWYQLPFLFQLLCALPLAMGIIAYIIALPGFAFAKTTFNKKDFIIFISYPAFLFLAFSALSRLGYPHLYLPVVPFLAVTAGICIDRLLTGNFFLKTTGLLLVTASFLFNFLAFRDLNHAQSSLVADSLGYAESARPGKAKTAVFFPYRPLAGSQYAQDFIFFPQFLLSEQWLRQNHPERILVHQTFYRAYLNHPELESRAGLGFEALIQGKAGYRLEKEWQAKLVWAKVYEHLFPDLKNLSAGLYLSTSWSGP